MERTSSCDSLFSEIDEKDFGWCIGERRVIRVTSGPFSSLLVCLWEQHDDGTFRRNEKKGVCLSEDQWQSLHQHITTIDRLIEVIQNKGTVKEEERLMKLDNGEGLIKIDNMDIYASMSTGFHCVNLRRFIPKKWGVGMLPTSQGIALKFPEWKHLKDILGHLCLMSAGEGAEQIKRKRQEEEEEEEEKAVDITRMVKKKRM